MAKKLGWGRNTTISLVVLPKEVDAFFWYWRGSTNEFRAKA
jgi:hypothetical protein